MLIDDNNSINAKPTKLFEYSLYFVRYFNNRTALDDNNSQTNVLIYVWYKYGIMTKQSNNSKIE